MRYPFTADAMIHSKNCVGKVEVLEELGPNDYKVKTEDGVTCHAIFNGFTALYYADDKYEVIEEND